MKITTPHGTLEGDNIETILKEHGYDCLHDADLRYADLSDVDLRDANHVQLSIAKISILPDEGDIIGWKKAYVDGTMLPKSVIVKLLIPSDAQRSNATGANAAPAKHECSTCKTSKATAFHQTPRHTADTTQTSRTKKAKPFTSKTSTPTGGKNAPPASTSSSPASKQSNTKESPNEQ